RNETELKSCAKRAKADGWNGDLIVQPFVEGVPASVALVTGPGGKFCLKPTWQHLSDDGRFRYLGGGLPLPPALATAARAAAVRVLPAIEGLRGWFGVDLVLGPEQNVIVEINPRLTTS